MGWAEAGGEGRSQQAVGPWNGDSSAGTHQGPSPSPCHQQPPYPSLSRGGTSNPVATLALFLLPAHIQPVRKFCLRFHSSDPEPAAAPASPPVPVTLHYAMHYFSVSLLNLCLFSGRGFPQWLALSFRITGGSLGPISLC